MANEKKQNLVQNLTDLLLENKNFALVSFNKTTHQSMEQLRRDLKKSNAKMRVIKNTLLEKAITKLGSNDKNYEEFKKSHFPLKDTTAVIILNEDWSSGIKAFHEYTKKEASLDFKLAYLDEKIYPTDEIKRIATLPSKPELMAKLIGQLKTPVAKVTYATKYNIQKFVYILSAKSKKAN